MTNQKTSRRRFLRIATATAAATAFGRIPPGVAIAQPPGTIRVRRDVASLDPSGPEIQALKAGVAAMKARTAANPSDPTGWRGQALIHQTQCPHGNWFFLPWHRGYLYYFEQICRHASGDTNFVLPYWNWTTSRRLPEVFWGDGANPLFHARAIGPMSQASLFAVGQTVIDDILAISDFETFASFKPNPVEQRRFAGYGELEGTPHNHIHGFVGGDMATFMSPLDPCFWLHHANIDRLWAEWVESNPSGNISDVQWRQFNFGNNFFDVNGNAIANATVESTLSTYAMGYRYDTQSPIAPELVTAGAAITEPLAAASAAINAELTAGAPLGTSLELPGDLREKLQFAATKAIPDIKQERGIAPTVRLTIEGVTPPMDTDVLVRVFLNCPYLSESIGPTDPHYVSSFSFFEHRGDADDGAHAAHGGSRSFSFDLTHTLQELQSVGAYRLDEPLQVQLLAVPAHDRPYSEKIRAARYRVAYIETSAEPAVP